MTSQLNKPVRTRLVGETGGRKIFAIDCGGNACNGGAFGARGVDVVRQRKVFAFASECLHRLDLGVPLGFVHIDCNPPYGIPTVVKLKLQFTDTDIDQITCWGTACPTAYLTYSEITDSWLGSISVLTGTIDIEFWCDPDEPIGGYRYFVSFSGDCIENESGSGGGTQTFPLLLECVWPFRAGSLWPVPGIFRDCCDEIPQGDHQISFSVTGVTLDRYLSRLVDALHGRKVFSIGECCPEDECEVDETCCGCEASPRTWSFTVSGVIQAFPSPSCTTPDSDCPAFNRTWTVDYVGSCRWEADHPGICTPGPPWQLTCDGDVWRLQTTNGGGGATTYELAVSSWKCFGPNVMTKVTESILCTGFPSTITLTAV